MTVKHPAKFSDSVLIAATAMFDKFGWPDRILDPFAGTGRIHRFTRSQTVGVELESEWAAIEPNTVVSNALALPFADATFDGLCTSPVYGNRASDHHEARDPSHRNSYRHVLGRALHADNSGRLQWGDAYRAFHDRAWAESLRVLKPGALIVLNVSNHIRGGDEQRVSQWHMNWFTDHDCYLEDLDVVHTRRLREGANREARVGHEFVFALRYGAPNPTEVTP